VFDLRTGQLRFHELVAHGKGTGENLAERFSDDMDSHQSSLGLFVTRDTYIWNNGYSLRLDGLEPGFNSRRARARESSCTGVVRRRGLRGEAGTDRPELGLPGAA
jgi:hypothetical protein